MTIVEQLVKPYKIATHPYLWKIAGRYTKSVAQHPIATVRETARTFKPSLGIIEEPEPGLIWDSHCHTTFSDGSLTLPQLVDLLFDLKVSFVSLTDHNNTDGFDNLARGNINLNRNSTRSYDLEVHRDRRSITIYDESHHLTLIRAIEYLTTEGEIGIHGLEGDLPKVNEDETNLIPVEEAIKRASDMGGWSVIHHVGFYKGLGWNGRQAVDEAIKAGAIALEINGKEIFIQVYSPIWTRQIARETGLPLISSNDSHMAHDFGRNGVVFDQDRTAQVLEQNDKCPVDTLRDLVERKEFSTFTNYSRPLMFLRDFPFGNPEKQ
jgi:predicted metal-dependent phosphoesterase TrpH